MIRIPLSRLMMLVLTASATLSCGGVGSETGTPAVEDTAQAAVETVDHLAQFWSPILDKLSFQAEIPLLGGDLIAWAVRKDASGLEDDLLTTCLTKNKFANNFVLERLAYL